jgi:hypothetical protein
MPGIYGRCKIIGCVVVNIVVCMAMVIRITVAIFFDIFSNYLL